MKKLYAVIIICTLIFSMVMSGCNNEKNYIVNADDTITIGVIVSSEESGVYSGISYASELAHSVNIDKTYEIKTKVALTDSDFKKTADDFVSEKVAAVICEGTDSLKTDAIVKAFSSYDIPLIFTDCYSDLIEKTDSAYSIGIPYSYQVSAAVSQLAAQNLQTGAVVCIDDSNYCKSFAKLFDSTFKANGGHAVTTYYYRGEESNFNCNTISAAAYDFVFLIGNTSDNIKIYSELKNASLASTVIFSEVTDKILLETSDFNSVYFINKFEADDNNYIGTDFINTYREQKNISTSDVTSSIAYGYDAYMTIYDALVSMHKNSESIFNTTDSSNEDTSIYTKDVIEALNSITHMGVTDVIKFNSAGINNTSFVYLDRIDNSRANMQQKYSYENE